MRRVTRDRHKEKLKESGRDEQTSSHATVNPSPEIGTGKAKKKKEKKKTFEKKKDKNKKNYIKKKNQKKKKKKNFNIK